MTTYISATLAPGEAEKIIRVHGKPGAQRVTKAALRAALKADPNGVQFISTDSYHRDGSWFTLGEAVTTFGPRVGIQVPLGATTAMINADARSAVVL